MASIDKSKFQFVKRDDFASETIDAPAYSRKSQQLSCWES